MKSNETLIFFDDIFMKKLQDPKEVQRYLDISFEEYAEDNDFGVLLRFLDYIATAKGGTLQLEEKAEDDVESLHKLLGTTQTPTWEAVLEALGYVFSPLSTETVPSY